MQPVVLITMVELLDAGSHWLRILIVANGNDPATIICDYCAHLPLDTQRTGTCPLSYGKSVDS